MIAVLWIMIGIAAVATAATLEGRDAVNAAQNRIDLLRARWMAEGCAERAIAAADVMLSNEDSTQVVWRALALNVGNIAVPAFCQVRLAPMGLRLNVNTASESLLRQLFATLGDSPAKADSLVDAIVDWRDVDSEPQPLGAEASWYAHHGRLTPRNGPLAANAEMHLIRGLETDTRVDSLLDVESGRMLLSGAPLALLRALPGMSDEAIAVIREWRATSDERIDLSRVADRLAGPAKSLLVANLARLEQLTCASPEAWILRSTSSLGEPPLAATVEERLALSGGRVAITRVRLLP